MTCGFYIRRDAVPGIFDDRPRWYTNGYGWSTDRAKAKRFFDFDEAWRVAINGDRVVSFKANGTACVSRPKGERAFRRNPPGRDRRIPGASYFLREAAKLAQAGTIEAEMLRRGEALIALPKSNDSAAGP